MTKVAPLEMFPNKLSHKKYRAALKKEKRKKRRRELARLRDSGLSQKEEEDAAIIEKQLKEEKLLQIERQNLHEEWLLREQKAQEDFRIKRQKEEAARKQQEEQEESIQKMLEQAENELESGATWQNPEPPTDLRIMDKDRATCPFYSKTGACRFGDREEECQAALSLFNGRWYAGRQLQCEFCPVTRWKMAICEQRPHGHLNISRTDNQQAFILLSQRGGWPPGFYRIDSFSLLSAQGPRRRLKGSESYEVVRGGAQN
ncbi:U2 small nuclear ribonucleoprotein auxiliary factor 35 kDa subunit-related protein 2-like [Mesoplodon densirostris]|uniref:U2 small nuclear ribonucleoprotein auxiliary factor 35 kDa subunit-related protein 2-like n=1 Tax=Mesoplodon densirostris TaxID=48708 RepID=UPI0028DC7F90|nr:U2 small nuclear ribonucleoprotein auxiliary factor 35 kDa subunit-related protein 2-like [Mesoplodon densirostris]